MTKAQDILEAQKLVVDNWHEAGEKIIETLHVTSPLNITLDEFLQDCTACGGNWGGMLLTGIKRKNLKVWELIPENMGSHAWECICATLTLMGVEWNKEN